MSKDAHPDQSLFPLRENLTMLICDAWPLKMNVGVGAGPFVNTGLGLISWSISGDRTKGAFERVQKFRLCGSSSQKGYERVP
jgi:hypothetical protein